MNRQIEGNLKGENQAMGTRQTWNLRDTWNISLFVDMWADVSDCQKICWWDYYHCVPGVWQCSTLPWPIVFSKFTCLFFSYPVSCSTCVLHSLVPSVLQWVHDVGSFTFLQKLFVWAVCMHKWDKKSWSPSICTQKGVKCALYNAVTQSKVWLNAAVSHNVE